MSDPQPFDIFRAGTHTAMSGVTLTFSEADLDAMADAYGLRRHAAPIVVGHPAHDAPAYGWVRALVREGETLRAIPEQIDPAFAELVRAGRYKKVSASFYAPDSGANPVPGVYYLRHVGFLGAQPPAVKGLREAVFGSGDADLITIEFSDAEPPSAGDAPGEPPSILPDPDEAPMPDPDLAAREAALAAQQSALAAQQAELDARETRVRESEAAMRRAAHADYAETLITQGRLLPKDKEGLVAFMDALPVDAPLAFGEGEGAFKGASAQWLRQFLSGLPVQVAFGEHAKDQPSAPSAAFRAPAEHQVDPERLALHARALAYQESHPGTLYADAVTLISQGA